jgi:hypothetical protein
MRVLNLVIVLVVIAAIGACVVAYFDIAPVPVLSDVAWKIKGYGAASTPDEALDRFKKGLEARNYLAASRFLDGDYQIQFRKQAKVSEKLAKAIDNFRSAGQDRSLIDPRVEAILAVLEPWPKSISIKDVKPPEGDSTTAKLTTESSSRLLGKGGLIVRLKKSGGSWRIDIPLDPVSRAHFDEIEEHGQGFVNALDVVKNRMKGDATTKENVFGDLREEVNKVKKIVP